MDHLVALDGFADPIKELAESRTAWVESVKNLDKEAQPEQAITFFGEHATDSPGGGDRDADLRQAVETVRTEVQQLAKIVAGGDTALATKQVIESSAVYKVGADSSTPGLALIYAMQLAWDLPLSRGVQRKILPVPVLSDEFQKFADVTQR